MRQSTGVYGTARACWQTAVENKERDTNDELKSRSDEW